jgi:hypothetical protein
MRRRSAPRRKIERRKSCGNAGAVESVESQKKASHSSHEPLGNLAKKPARFPHSHSSGDEGGWKSGKPKAGFPLSHRLDFSLSKEKNRSASGLRPPPAAALLSASVVPFCSAVVGNFHSALDKKSRSKEFSFGRGRFRLSTATCCRRARTSRAVCLRLRKNTRMPTMNERMNSSTNSPL